LRPSPVQARPAPDPPCPVPAYAVRLRHAASEAELGSMGRGEGLTAGAAQMCHGVAAAVDLQAPLYQAGRRPACSHAKAQQQACASEALAAAQRPRRKPGPVPCHEGLITAHGRLPGRGGSGSARVRGPGGAAAAALRRPARRRAGCRAGRAAPARALDRAGAAGRRRAPVRRRPGAAGLAVRPRCLDSSEALRVARRACTTPASCTGYKACAPGQM